MANFPILISIMTINCISLYHPCLYKLKTAKPKFSFKIIEEYLHGIRDHSFLRTHNIPKNKQHQGERNVLFSENFAYVLNE